MTFTFKPATRDKVGLLFGLAGASGSGKTYSAMRLAKGIANGHGQMCVIDTEAGRAKHYADRFKFLHGDFEPPFEPKRYVEAIRAAEDAGGSVILVDSMSHEWAGEGGCSDMQAREAERMATDRDGNLVPWKVESMTAPAWKKPKIEHKRMVSRLLQTRSHLIFCLRAEEKVKFLKDEKGKQQIVPQGFQPICEKGFMFEMTAFITLHPDTPGVVRYDLPHKLNEDLRAIFPNGSTITEESGARLREWAEAGEDVRPSAEEQRIIDGARAMIEAIEDSDAAGFQAMMDGEDFKKRRAWFATARAELSRRLEDAIAAAVARFAPTTRSDDDDFPGDRT